MKKFFLIFCLFTSMFAQSTSFNIYETKIPTVAKNNSLKIMISPTIVMSFGTYTPGLNVVIAVQGDEADFLFNDKSALKLLLYNQHKDYIFDGRLVKKKYHPGFRCNIYTYDFLGDKNIYWSNIRNEKNLWLRLAMSQLDEIFIVNMDDFRKNIDVLRNNFIQNKASHRVDF